MFFKAKKSKKLKKNANNTSSTKEQELDKSALLSRRSNKTNSTTDHTTEDVTIIITNADNEYSKSSKVKPLKRPSLSYVFACLKYILGLVAWIFKILKKHVLYLFLFILVTLFVYNMGANDDIIIYKQTATAIYNYLGYLNYNLKRDTGQNINDDGLLSENSIMDELENYKREIQELKVTIKQKDEYINKLSSEKPYKLQADIVFDKIKTDLSKIMYTEINDYLKACDLNITFTIDDIKLSEPGIYSIIVDFWNIMYKDLKKKLSMNNSNSDYYKWFKRENESDELYNALRRKSVDLMVHNLLEDGGEYRCCCKYGKNSKYTCGNPNERPSYHNPLPSNNDMNPPLIVEDVDKQDSGFSKTDTIRMKSNRPKENNEGDNYHSVKNAGTTLNDIEKHYPQCILHDYFDIVNPLYKKYETNNMLLDLKLSSKFFKNINNSKLNHDENPAPFDPYLLNCKISFLMM